MKSTLLLLCILLMLTACEDKIEPGRVAAEPLTISDLPLLTLQPSAQQGAEQFVGSVESRDRATLVARSSGQITRLAAREGERVAKGQLLVEISDNSASEQLNAAEAAIAVAQGRRDAAQAKLTLADQTAGRYRQLQQAEAVTPQELDQVVAELELARQQLVMAEAEQAQARAARDSVRQQNSYNRVVAPYTGQLVSLQIKPGGTVLPGTPLLTIDRDGPRQARISIPERLLGQLVVGTAIQVNLPAINREISGAVLQVQGGSDPQSRSFEAIVSLPGGEDLPTGLFVRASRALPSDQLLLIPATAVTSRGQLSGVFVVQQGILRFRLVRIGRSFAEQVEVLSGLSAGEQLVSAEVNRAVAGARVE
ncbi:MAG TPA: efflux RND transporter periplasmic adaptor subunit [Malonomonas sp.]